MFRRYLRERSLPVTSQREQVAEVLFAAGGHLSVEDVEQAAARAAACTSARPPSTARSTSWCRAG